jgi:heat shock protein HslJ
MHRTRKLAAMVAAALLVVALSPLAGCGSDEAAEFALEDTYWVNTTYSNGDELVDVLSETHMDIVFSGAEVNGSSGCNRYGGAYTLDGNSIGIGPLTSTLMACEEPLMEQETAYLAAVQSAAEWDIDGSTLTLFDSGGAEVAVYEADMSPLTGQMWLCTGYNNGKEAVVSVALDTTITIEFAENEKATGSSGCNTYEAGYEADDEGAMEFSEIAVTEMFCASPEGIMEQEEAYLSALETVAAYEIQGSFLTLRTAEGAAAATFARQ